MRGTLILAAASVLLAGCGSSTGEARALAEQACLLVLTERITEAYEASTEARIRDEQWGDLHWSLMIISAALDEPDPDQLSEALELLDQECAEFSG